MPSDLEPVRSPEDVRLNVEAFTSEMSGRYRDRAARLLQETTYWVHDPASGAFGPSKFVGFVGMSLEKYQGAVDGDAVGARFDGGLTRRAIETALNATYIEDDALSASLEQWGVTRFGPQAFGRADRAKWRFVTLAYAAPPMAPALPLALHGRFTRKDVYGLFGIDYDTRKTRHLNVGLSPQMSDGGYQLFITLDKETLAESYDYEDVLFGDQLVWVTRRDADEKDPDYVALRDPGTRVSLFLRRKNKEAFVYLGEVRARDHEQFTNEGRVQQRYFLTLNVPVPPLMMAELSGGMAPGDPSRRVARAPEPAPHRQSRSVRRPATLDDYQRAFRYALGTLERHVVPAHQHYQMRLRGFLEAGGVSAEWERDFIDVQWQRAGQTWIGEVKVTRYLTVEEAFRAALGQLLVYAAKHPAVAPRLVMFLDQTPEEALLKLAARLDVAVVVETAPGRFELRSESTDTDLASLFGSSSTA